MDKLVKHHCNIRAREMMIAYETSTVAKTLFAFVLITLFAGIKGKIISQNTPVLYI